MATEVLMPRQGQSVESCILVEWLVKEGDSVKAGQPVASIETDKAVFEVESPSDGVMLAQFFPAGDDIPVLTVIGAVGEAGEDVSGMRPEGGDAAAPVAQPAPAPAAEVAPAQPSEAAAGPVAGTEAQLATGGDSRGVSPRARKRAAEGGVSVEGIAGTGPGGRVLARDVEQVAAQQPRMSAAAKEAAAGGAAVPAVGSGPGGMVLAGDLAAASEVPAAAATAPMGTDREIPVKGIRKLIAQKMCASLSQTAQITLNKSFDATALLAYREKVKAYGEALGLPNITINDLIAYATVLTLRRHRGLNAHFLGDRIVEKGQVNLGIATDTERGLMVPVVHGAEGLSLRELSAAIKPLVKASQSGSINPDVLQGGTFTITNLGILGMESFTPVLNVPEVAILGVNGLFAKPVFAADGSVKHVQAITLSLTVDHQAVDGAPAARFLKDLCTALEQIELVLAG